MIAVGEPYAAIESLACFYKSPDLITRAGAKVPNSVETCMTDQKKLLTICAWQRWPKQVSDRAGQDSKIGTAASTLAAVTAPTFESDYNNLAMLRSLSYQPCV